MHNNLNDSNRAERMQTRKAPTVPRRAMEYPYARLRGMASGDTSLKNVFTDRAQRLTNQTGVWALLLVLLASPQVSAQKFVYTVKSGWSDEAFAYQTDLLNLLLKSTEDKYGKTELIVRYQGVSIERARQIIMSTGDEVYLGFSSDWEFVHRRGGLTTKRPYFQHMLGLRRCLIKRGNSKVQNVRSIDDLKTLRFGSGSSWPDTQVYKHNGITVFKADRLKSLYKMLEYGRFDCLPLSVLETNTEYPESSSYTATDAFYIYFPLQVFINTLDEKLISRFDLGYDVTKKNGEFDKLFKRHFSSRLPEKINIDQVIRLHHPDRTQVENETAWQEFKKLIH